MRSERALARDPQPVGQDDVGAAADQRDLAGFGGGELGGLEIDTGFLVEAIGADDRQLPAEGAGRLDGEPQFVGGVRGEEAEGGSPRGSRRRERRRVSRRTEGNLFRSGVQFDGPLSPLTWLSAENCAKSILPTSIAALVRL